MRLPVDGMSCEHCVRAVTMAAESVPGVESVEVDLPGGFAVVTGHGVDPAILARAIEAEGFRVRPE